ncbi:uncharacterized protein I303_104587 [Kwoniella dejecticola CBS 10117]|uniref:6-phosphogluconate dehydrogenase NADP-binding domain-containing protein n=1 Tax=Kwoniella dejecticola CBS 10117 TaxID=1296121 RepID=A0A1A6A4W5_9TREE|nr:uncharacterized protein I303_04436 [Kwoniella dejecticola CBS 10117]OBR85105.1 hypothetical protein I303_04436 [Kwoniella dejecticola CBS 10117]
MSLSLSPNTRIGFVGLGNMGSHIAANLSKHISANNLPNLTVWNRSKGKYDQLRSNPNLDQDKITYAEELKEVIENSDVIFSMLIDDHAAQEIFSQFFDYLRTQSQAQTETKRREVIFVDQSSLKAITSGKLAEQAKEVGSTYLACPVFGRPPMAQAAKLLIISSGPSEAQEKVKQLLKPVIGDRLIDVGEDVKKATAIKSMGNMVLLGWIELLSESYALGDSIGIDPKIFDEFLQKFIPAPPLLAYSNTISKGIFPSGGGFSVDGGLKDARNMISLGTDLGHPVSLPTIERAKANMERAKEIGGKDQDWSSLAIAIREQAGLQPYRDGTNGGKGTSQ